MKLSVVTTLYRSAATVEQFVARASSAAATLTPDYEIVIVDDGSPDESLAIAVRLAEADPHLRIIELSRNFGHHKALMTGMMHAVGEYVFLIDSDLEEAPELLGEFWPMLQSEELDVVYGYQHKRGGDPIRRASGRTAYWLLDQLLPFRVPHNHLTVRLMRRAYVESLIRHREHQVVIGGLWVITGYRQRGVAVDKGDRGMSSYSFRQRWSLMIDSVTSFSETPLIAIFYVGTAICLISGLMGCYLFLRWLFGGVGVEGWLSVMLSVWFLGGLAIFFIGIIGIYLSKIFIETKNRPYTLIRRIYQATEQNIQR